MTQNQLLKAFHYSGGEYNSFKHAAGECLGISMMDGCFHQAYGDSIVWANDKLKISVMGLVCGQ